MRGLKTVKIEGAYGQDLFQCWRQSSQWFLPTSNKRSHRVEETPRLHSLFQSSDPQRRLFLCDYAVLLDRTHSFDKVRDRANGFVVRCDPHQ